MNIITEYGRDISVTFAPIGELFKKVYILIKRVSLKRFNHEVIVVMNRKIICLLKKKNFRSHD